MGGTESELEGGRIQEMCFTSREEAEKTGITCTEDSLGAIDQLLSDPKSHWAQVFQKKKASRRCSGRPWGPPPGTVKRPEAALSPHCSGEKPSFESDNDFARAPLVTSKSATRGGSCSSPFSLFSQDAVDSSSDTHSSTAASTRPTWGGIRNESDYWARHQNRFAPREALPITSRDTSGSGPSFQMTPAQPWSPESNFCGLPGSVRRVNGDDCASFGDIGDCAVPVLELLGNSLGGTYAGSSWQPHATMPTPGFPQYNCTPLKWGYGSCSVPRHATGLCADYGVQHVGYPPWCGCAPSLYHSHFLADVAPDPSTLGSVWLAGHSGLVGSLLFNHKVYRSTGQPRWFGSGDVSSISGGSIWGGNNDN